MFFMYEIDNQKFGGFVAALRKEKGYTQKELAEKLFDEVIAVASGKEVKSEIAGFHDMAIFKQGVTL